MAFCLIMASAGPFGTMAPSRIRTLMKRTYCREMQGQRVYVQEQLEDDCVERVQFFGNKVSKWPFVDLIPHKGFPNED